MQKNANLLPHPQKIRDGPPAPYNWGTSAPPPPFVPPFVNPAILGPSQFQGPRYFSHANQSNVGAPAEAAGKPEFFAANSQGMGDKPEVKTEIPATDTGGNR